MPTIEDGINALVARLQGVPGRPAIHYPDSAQDTPPPRLVVSIPANAQNPRFLDGSTEAFPEINVRVETVSGDFGRDAGTYVAAIQAHFAAGQIIAGNVSLFETPQARSRYTVDGIYHVPLVIRGRMYF